MNEHASVEQQNVAVVKGFYDALGSAGDGGLSEESMAIVVATFQNEQSIELNLGELYGGRFVGPANIAIGRHRLHELSGYTAADHSAFSYSAVGPTRVVVEAVNNGTTLAGEPWSMTVVELVDVIDGKIARKRTFFEDPVRLTTIMKEREAALQERLVEQYWRNDNPLVALSGAEN